MSRQRVRILLIICFLAAMLITLSIGAQTKKAFTANNLIRLHVIANSDDQIDQTVKYQVRDRIVELLKEQLTGIKDCQEAREVIKANRSKLDTVARETVIAAGFSYPVQVEFDRFAFPHRAYGSVVLPQGEYEAVKVVLGEGEGANWWGVLFPPLCFVDISGNPMDKDSTSAREVLAVQESLTEYKAEQGQNSVDLRFRLLDWLRQEDGYLAKNKGR